MKNITKMIGLLTLIAFSFFYSDKVITVIKEQDPIMIELENIKGKYYTLATDAVIEEDTIIPGLYGKQINIDKSYSNMKTIGKFTANAIEYEEIIPNVTLKKNKDKYIIAGNPEKQMVSLIFILNSDNYFNKLETIIKNKNIEVNYFVDYNYLVKNSTEIKNINNNEIYSYGNNGEYTPDNLLFSNNLINRITNNNTIYCLSKTKNKKVLSLCSSYDLYTIIPSITVIGDPYSDVKNNLKSGSIILLNIDNKTLNQLEIIIDYIQGKGLKIATLSKLLSEEE